MTPTNLPTIQDIDSFAGRTFFVRGSLNVPLADEQVVQDQRLTALLPTLEYICGRGGRVVLAGHLSDATATLAPVAEYLREQTSLTFAENLSDDALKKAVGELGNGEVLLLENLRTDPGEAANDERFARRLAGYADVYINEAFDAAHRPHASIVGVPQHLPAYAGLRFAREVAELSKIFDPKRPFVFVLGGAKFSTKLPLVEKFSVRADQVFVGGALANAYLQAAGQPVGSSRVPDESESYDLSAGLASDVLELPTDVVVQTPDGETETKSVSSVEQEDVIVDIGKQSLAAITTAAESAQLVVWNGPLEWYEKGLTPGSDKQLAEALTKIEGRTILGGGDTAAAILDTNITADDFSFFSIGGGAMIAFLSEETLPAIQALQK